MDTEQIAQALEDTAESEVRVRLADGEEVRGTVGEVSDGSVAIATAQGPRELALDEIADVLEDVRSADPE